MKLLCSRVTALELLMALLLLGLMLLGSCSAVTSINLAVLLPNMTSKQLKTIADDPCMSLQRVASEASLAGETLRDLFGWQVLDPVEADLSRQPSSPQLDSSSSSSGRSSSGGVTMSMLLVDSQCSDTAAPVAAMELYYRKSLSILFGPCCRYALSPVGRYAKTWNIPVITTGGLPRGFSDHVSFPTLVRFVPPYRKLAEFLLRYVLEEYSYRHFSMLFHENYLPARQTRGWSECGHLVDVMDLILLEQARMRVQYSESGQDYEDTGGYGSVRFHKEGFDEWDTRYWNSTAAFFEIRNNSRLVVLCASSDSIREIMLKAAELNFTNGEYVFVNIDLFSSGVRLERPWYRANDTESNNEKARQAYSPLMTVSLRKPSGSRYENFSREVRRRSRMKRERATEAYVEEETEEVNSFVGAFHDAVLLYALALNETLAEGLNATDGAALTRRMWNRTFEGVTGNVSIDENGDRNADYSLLDMDPETGSFQVVANFYGNERRYERVKPIYWGGELNEPPPDVPKCGFDGLGCPVDKVFPEYGIVIIVLGSLLFIVCLGSLLAYSRHYKLEAELAEVNWRVRWDDIMFGAQEKRKLERSNSRLSLFQNRRASISSCVSVDTIAVALSNIGAKQIFTKTGSYKATLVAIKKIVRPVTVTKPLLLDFKKMRDLQNDHVVRFIGVCIDAPNQCILTEYCQKGSLQDVLENEQIKLDNMFKFSLIQDIVRGMAYIHSSEIRCHGNLKSSNCVVDSRFVLKITDFGLHNLRVVDSLSPDDSYAFYRSKLWTAPELLREVGSDGEERWREGTQKGDVYSFSIICQEVICRNGPFWIEKPDLSPSDIYKRVLKGERPLLRPSLPDPDDGDVCSRDLANLLNKCWSEEPAERPDFHNLKTIIKRINKEGDASGNLLDNLLSRMEQYANNLEALVEERTADYLEQKKRAEDLLYMMLPRSVAVQLMHGETVKAEKFESVSIYFSDICGFTALSAESTPMQVVNLLNDLYTTFDSIIDQYDVYKVETIGDAYMVVSGLPTCNGILHAREIGRMAITLLNAVKSFKIQHRPRDKLNLRIGIHSGPVCAGVVGMKMPRYCLFGDTVNTASRMESNGEPLRIHVSPYSKVLLDSFGSFILELRGPVAMKGKGEVTTWWLLGEVHPDFPDLAPPNSPAVVNHIENGDSPPSFLLPL